MSIIETCGKRSVRDAAGTLWQIGEVDALNVPGAQAARCLVFDSQAVCRRYWYYPLDWHSMTDHSLLDLMSQPRERIR